LQISTSRYKRVPVYEEQDVRYSKEEALIVPDCENGTGDAVPYLVEIWNQSKFSSFGDRTPELSGNIRNVQFFNGIVLNPRQTK
jgi:hypothetical protein